MLCRYRKQTKQLLFSDRRDFSQHYCPVYPELVSLMARPDTTHGIGQPKQSPFMLRYTHLPLA